MRKKSKKNSEMREGKKSPSLSPFQIARFRQGVYRLLAAWLLYPDEEILSLSPSMAEVLGEMEEISASFPFYALWKNLLTRLEKLQADELESLQEEYMELFGGSGLYKQIPLTESAYLADKQGMGILLGSLTREYQSFGVDPADSVAPDHIAVEMEFMSSLCEREAEEWEGENNPTAFMELEKKFLKVHLFSWIPTLQKRVESRQVEGFYHLLLSTLVAVIAQDLDYLEYLAEN